MQYIESESELFLYTLLLSMTCKNAFQEELP
jgi:hypothetical protein